MQTASKRQKKGNNAPKKKKASQDLLWRYPRERGSSLVAAPASMGVRTGPRVPPRITNTSKGVIVRHKEMFLVPSVVDASFVTSGYWVNPGMTSVFPWLSSIALRYETYRFHSLRFIWQSQCPTISPGSVGLALDFDVSDPGPADLMEYMSMQDSTVGPVWSPLALNVDLSGSHGTFKYVRAGMPAGTWDQKTYDLGSFYFMTNGLTVPTSPGMVLVEYEIELCTPQIQDPAAGSIYAPGGLSATNLVGTYGSVGHTKLPFHTDGARLIFDQAWEGVITLVCSGAGLVAPLIFNEATLLEHKNDQSFVNPAATWCYNSLIVKAAVGAVLTLYLTAGAVGSSRWYFGKGGYDQF